jgi:hypothetical protein
MQNMVLLIIVPLLLSALWMPLALAEPTELTEPAAPSVRPPLLSTRLVCTTDRDPIFGERGEARGSAAISATGDVRIILSGLAPRTALTCVMACGVGNGGEENVLIVREPCRANAQGRLNVTYRGVARASAIGGGCLLPLIAAGNNQVACFPGYGRVNTEPPKR